MLSIHQFEFDIIEAIQEVGEWLRPAMDFFSALGTTEVYLAILMIVYWCVDRRAGLRLALMLPLNGAVNDILKMGFHEPRPFWVNTEIEAYRYNMGFGLPSGHAQSAAGFWGLSAHQLGRRPFYIIFIFLILLIGLSRIYLGVHSLIQVLCGFVIGSAFLFLFVRYEKPAVTVFSKMSMRWKIMLSQAIPAMFILVGVLIVALLDDWTLPIAWVENYEAASGKTLESALHVRGIAQSSGMLSGVILGIMILGKAVDLNCAVVWWKLVLRVIVGIAVVLSVLAVTRILVSEIGEDENISHFIRYVGSMLAAVWAIGVYPRVFEKMKLA